MVRYGWYFHLLFFKTNLYPYMNFNQIQNMDNINKKLLITTIVSLILSVFLITFMLFKDNGTQESVNTIITTDTVTVIKRDTIFNEVQKTIVKPITNSLQITKKLQTTKIDYKSIPHQIEKLTALMNQSAKELDFERAILLREQIQQLKDLAKKGESL